MDKKHIFLTLSMIAGTLSMSSCLDFDNPEDTLSVNQDVVTPTPESGKGTPDSIPYQNVASKAFFVRKDTPAQGGKDLGGLRTKSTQQLLSQAAAGYFCLRGGKKSETPGPHAYQYAFSLGTDNYAQYMVVPHHDFMAGELSSTYAISPSFRGGARGGFSEMKNQVTPLLNSLIVDSIPEIKAMYLLVYDFGAQEQADLFGAFAYTDYLHNSTTPPFTYEGGRDIYEKIVQHIDTAIACFKHFDSKPEYYKKAIFDVKLSNDMMTTDMMTDRAQSFETWIRFANSLKLRMAMHMVKVDPEQARQWAEEAVKGGVIESDKDQTGLFIQNIGINHPLSEIANSWNDTRVSASFESLLTSLGHPYLDYVITKNSDDIVNEKTKSVLKGGTRCCGMREGEWPGQGQNASVNPYLKYASLNAEAFSTAPLYYIKWAEVDFLRAEGALRGWEMGGTAEFFYNRGIEHAFLEDPSNESTTYKQAMATYKELEKPHDFTWTDPLGISLDEPSVTKIGVKWNESDSPETKLEKIITQKYIALFPYSYEAWTEMRRTGYPKVFYVLNADDGDGSLSEGDLIRRIPFPETDDQSLIDIANTGLKALGGPDQQATRVWWDRADKGNF